MTNAMAEKTLAVLHQLEDFEQACLQAEIDMKDRKLSPTLGAEKSQLLDMRLAIAKLRESVTRYRAPKTPGSKAAAG